MGKYKQAMSNDIMTRINTLNVEKVNNVQYLKINEFIYEHNSNHKKQCYNDNDREYEICLEFKEVEKEMLLYLNNEFDWILFENDKAWNEINHINDNDRNKKNEKIQKCIHYHQRKICVIKKLYKNTNNQ